MKTKSPRLPARNKTPLLRKIEPYLWILPSVILMSIFIIVPIGQVFHCIARDI